MASFWWPGGAAVVVDALAFGRGLEPLRWANYAFVWIAVHQLGMVWRSMPSSERMVWVTWFFAGLDTGVTKEVPTTTDVDQSVVEVITKQQAVPSSQTAGWVLRVIESR